MQVIKFRRYTTMQTSNTFSMLKTAMRSNAIFSGLAALTFVFAAPPLARLIGLPTSTTLIIVGVSLVIWAAELFIGTKNEEINQRFAQFVIAGDLLWVIGSTVLFFSDWVPFTPAGKWLIAIQADIILIFAVWQYFGLRKTTN